MESMSTGPMGNLHFLQEDPAGRSIYGVTVTLWLQVFEALHRRPVRYVVIIEIFESRMRAAIFSCVVGLFQGICFAILTTTPHISQRENWLALLSLPVRHD